MEMDASPYDNVERLPKQGEAPERKIRSTQEMLDDQRGPGKLALVRRTIVVLLAIVAVVAVVFVVASALDPDNEPRSASWNAPSAPDVAPLNISGQ